VASLWLIGVYDAWKRYYSAYQQRYRCEATDTYERFGHCAGVGKLGTKVRDGCENHQRRECDRMETKPSVRRDQNEAQHDDLGIDQET